MKLLYEGIMKIQLPLASSPGSPNLALAYDRKRKHMRQIPVEEVVEKMQGESKKFFHCKVFELKIEIGDEAPHQDW